MLPTASLTIRILVCRRLRKRLRGRIQACVGRASGYPFPVPLVFPVLSDFQSDAGKELRRGQFIPGTPLHGSLHGIPFSTPDCCSIDIIDIPFKKRQPSSRGTSCIQLISLSKDTSNTEERLIHGKLQSLRAKEKTHFGYPSPQNMENFNRYMHQIHFSSASLETSQERGHHMPRYLQTVLTTRSDIRHLRIRTLALPSS